jgi:hypothetical protein
MGFALAILKILLTVEAHLFFNYEFRLTNYVLT